jgi:hypothetical protein
MGQEPGDAEQIGQFCSLNYGEILNEKGYLFLLIQVLVSQSWKRLKLMDRMSTPFMLG